MTEDILEVYSIFVRNIKIFSFIGSREVSYKEIEAWINQEIVGKPEDKWPQEYRKAKNPPAGYMKELEPLVRIKSNMKYYIDMVVMRTMLGHFYNRFLDGIFSKEAIADLITERHPTYMMAEIASVENEDHEAYRDIYESALEEIEELREDKDSLTANLESQEQLAESSAAKARELEEDVGKVREELQALKTENANLKATLENLKENNPKAGENLSNVANLVEKWLEQEPVVFDIRIDEMDKDKPAEKPVDISTFPAIYSGKRPSWFTSLQKELSKEGQKKRNANNAMAVIWSKLAFLKEHEDEYDAVLKLANEIDQRRAKEIKEILDSDAGNEEKYLKYMLLTPGMDREYMKTINGASELGLDANTVIAFLEQPLDKFNRTVFEAFVSEAHKGNSYNYKAELARELVYGEWYISATMDGKVEKFQLVPWEKIQSMADEIRTLCGVKTAGDTTAPVANSEEKGDDK